MESSLKESSSELLESNENDREKSPGSTDSGSGSRCSSSEDTAYLELHTTSNSSNSNTSNDSANIPLLLARSSSSNKLIYSDFIPRRSPSANKKAVTYTFPTTDISLDNSTNSASSSSMDLQSENDKGSSSSTPIPQVHTSSLFTGRLPRKNSLRESMFSITSSSSSDESSYSSRAATPLSPQPRSSLKTIPTTTTSGGSNTQIDLNKFKSIAKEAQEEMLEQEKRDKEFDNMLGKQDLQIDISRLITKTKELRSQINYRLDIQVEERESLYHDIRYNMALDERIQTIQNELSLLLMRIDNITF